MCVCDKLEMVCVCVDKLEMVCVCVDKLEMVCVVIIVYCCYSSTVIKFIAITLNT